MEAEQQGKSLFANQTLFIVGVAIVALIVGALIGSNFFPSTTGLAVLPGDSTPTQIDKSAVSQKVLAYLNDNFLETQGLSAELVSIEDFDDYLYSVTVNINSGSQTVQQTILYASKDGKQLVAGTIFDLDTPLPPAEEEETGQLELVKSDRPEVELFVMSHCPYGTQIEKGILPAVELLGEKIDFKVRFVYYAMHGEKEVVEETRQYCIQKGQTAKFTDYLGCFLEDGNTDRCLLEANIDTEALESCFSEADSTFNILANLNDSSKWISGRYPAFDIDKELNTEYDVGGSPTLVINGMQASSGRDSASLLSTICSAFNEAPAECSTQLSSTTPSSGFGYGASAAGSAAECGV